MWISDSYREKADWLSTFADIKEVKFIKLLPDEEAKFEITYWDATDDSEYGRNDGLYSTTVNIPYELDWDYDEDNNEDYCILSDVGLVSLADVLTTEQQNYIYDAIESALGC